MIQMTTRQEAAVVFIQQEAERYQEMSPWMREIIVSSVQNEFNFSESASEDLVSFVLDPPDMLLEEYEKQLGGQG